MPWNGYPMRLLLPGYEGNMNVKWLRRIKLVDGPIDGAERDQALHDPAAERQGVAVLLSAGGEILHHQPVTRDEC